MSQKGQARAPYIAAIVVLIVIAGVFASLWATTPPGEIRTVTETQRITETVTTTAFLTPAPEELTITIPKWWSAASFYRDFWIPFFEGKMAEQGRIVKVRIIDYPAPDPPFIEKTITDLKAGTAPDVIFVDGFFIGQFAEAGYLVDLTPFVEKWPDWNNYYDSMKAMVTWKGKVWALPYETDIRPLYYRKDIFKLAGLPVPWEPKSWDDLLNAARTLKANAEKIKAALGIDEFYPIAIKMGKKIEEATTMQGFYMVLLGTGGRLYNFETGKWIAKSPELLETFRFLYKIYVEEELAVPADIWFGPDPIDAVHRMLSEGKVAIFPTWQGVWFDIGNPDHRWFNPNRDDVLAFTKMPGMTPDRPPVTISGGWTLAISHNARDKELAWEFLKTIFSLQMTVQRMIAFPGGLPPRVDAAEDALFRARMDPYTLWATTLVEVTTFRPGDPKYPEISAVVQEATERILLLKEKPEDVLEWFASRVKEIAGPGNWEER